MKMTISCPTTDYELFKRQLPGFVNIVKDEDIVNLTQLSTTFTLKQIYKPE
jgi:hypothetical protein